MIFNGLSVLGFSETITKESQAKHIILMDLMDSSC